LTTLKIAVLAMALTTLKIGLLRSVRTA